MSLCLCGCGNETPLSQRTNNKKGIIKGLPTKYCRYHKRSYKAESHPGWKGGKSILRGYIGIWNPDHPRANHGRYVYEQILVAEAALGKPLPPKSLVHHFNEDPKDNRNENLIICQDTSYHQLLHRRKTAFLKSGHADWRQCIYCKTWDDPSNLCIRKEGHHPHHKSCVLGVKAVSSSSMAGTGRRAAWTNTSEDHT